MTSTGTSTAFHITSARKSGRVMTRLGSAALAVAAACSLTLVSSQPASAAASSVASPRCSTYINGQYYYAENSWTLAGTSGSAYYVSRYKTGGATRFTTSFETYQGLRQANGFIQIYSSIAAKSGLPGNTAFFVGPSWTGYSTAWITRNQSISGSTLEKVAVMYAHFTVNGTTGTCRLIARQP